MRRKSLLFLFLILFFSTACGSNMNPDDHLAEIYTIALNKMMEEESRQSESEPAFIAIDTSNMKRLNKQEIKGLIDYFHNSYGIETIEATFKNLKELDNPDTKEFDGVLLRIEKFNYTFFHNIELTGSKFQSQSGKMETEMIIKADNKKWIVQNAKLAWID